MFDMDGDHVPNHLHHWLMPIDGLLLISFKWRGIIPTSYHHGFNIPPVSYHGHPLGQRYKVNWAMYHRSCDRTHTVHQHSLLMRVSPHQFLHSPIGFKGTVAKLINQSVTVIWIKSTSGKKNLFRTHFMQIVNRTSSFKGLGKTEPLRKLL